MIVASALRVCRDCDLRACSKATPLAVTGLGSRLFRFILFLASPLSDFGSRERQWRIPCGRRCQASYVRPSCPGVLCPGVLCARLAGLVAWLLLAAVPGWLYAVSCREAP